MAKTAFREALLNSEGQPINGASVTVYDSGTGTPSTIYREDGVTALSNPFLTGYQYNRGEILFSADNGIYDVKIVNGGDTQWYYRQSLFDVTNVVFTSTLATEASPGIVEKATTAEMTAGTADKYPDAQRVKAHVDSAIGALQFLQDNRVTINFTTDANYTLSADENGYSQIRMTDTGVVLTASREVIIDAKAKIFSFINSTARTLSVKTSSGAAVTVYADGFIYDLYSDGIDVGVLEKNIPDSLNGTLYATVSGTSKDYTPPYWATKITLMLSGFSLSGTAVPAVQIGTGGSPETTGYSGAVGNVGATTNHSSQFLLRSSTGAATEIWHGEMILTLMDASSNLWSTQGIFSLSNTNNIWFMSGTKSLAGPLNLIRLKSSNGTDTFDAGSVNVRYE